MFSDIYARLLRDIIAQNNQPLGLDKKYNLYNDCPKGLSSTGGFSYLIQRAYEENPNSDIGITFGKQITPAHACEFSSMVTTAPTVERFIHLLISQYHRLGLKPYPVFFIDQKSACIALTYPYSSKFYSSNAHQSKRRFNRFCSESFYAYVVNVIRDLVDRDFSPSYMALDYSDPGYSDKYKYFFCSPIEFESGLSLLKFDRSILAKPLRYSNEQLHRVYLEKFSENWQAGEKRNQSYRYRAVTEMMLHAPNCFQIGKLAERLSISVRGLQKRLKNENSSFSELTMQVRRELLKICLVKSDMSLEDSADLLGFQTLSSFKRFFRECMENTETTT